MSQSARPKTIPLLRGTSFEFNVEVVVQQVNLRRGGKSRVVARPSEVDLFKSATTCMDFTTEADIYFRLGITLGI